jgi:hypothetical protein
MAGQTPISEDLEMGSRDTTPSQVQDTTSSRPEAKRSYTIHTPSFLRTNNTSSTQPPLLPVSERPNDVPTPTGTVGRNRAHTVSVSMRPRNRAGSINNTNRNRSGTVNNRYRSGSTASNGRRSGDTRRSGEERSGSPVTYEIAGNGEDEPRELHDEVVGMLDVIDPQVATSESF